MGLSPVIIGIAGGTGSGKTTVAQKVLERIDKSKIAMIEHDAYYKDQSHIPFEQRLKTNYDHPLAFDTELLLQHLKDLREEKTVQRPVYSFTTHTRQKKDGKGGTKEDNYFGRHFSARR